MKVLLHICCGPCALYPLSVLRAEGLDVTGWFYNHNIHPYKEYEQRRDNARKMAKLEDLELIEHDKYNLEEFLANVAADPASRCRYCYSSRLDAVARAAYDYGFDAFTSSLFYSRYQNHDLMMDMANKAAKARGAQFLYRDFRSGWQEGIRKSKELALYRQQYCGCIYSEKERYLSSTK